ncbi:MAG TPA: hypothetical protein VLJ39_00325 [Tepidisphaeraceae bacterium]|nr:hypothetical protein [Tepidisphaeraceae bacterium]
MAHQNADQPVHEAARAGLVDELATMLAMDASLINAKGIDARTPFFQSNENPVLWCSNEDCPTFGVVLDAGTLQPLEGA